MMSQNKAVLWVARPSRAASLAPSEGLALAEAAEEDDGLMADVVAMAGGAIGQDAIARLEVVPPLQLCLCG